MLFLDADGATHFSEISKIYDAVRTDSEKHPKRFACIIGSRNTGESEVQRKGLRKFLAWGMNTLVKFVLGFPIKDT